MRQTFPVPVAAADAQVALHAMGNEAVAHAARSIAAARDLHRLPGRPRIEYGLFLDDALARQVGHAGIVIAAQPI